ncbi:hypothetical protein IRJ41_007666 [Triplophysa rosa]|uniref:ISXO2-like transposase domain-containing protein n=1 Tax=Triplophysa rosa TaxID=992332 RepID=A0A9W7T4X4_TRIRA|nr:hypothetical protein IRJ41_007666 [Triplophysa rosa]
MYVFIQNNNSLKIHIVHIVTYPGLKGYIFLPEQVIKRYKKVLGYLKGGTTKTQAYFKCGVDRKSIVDTAAIAELEACDNEAYKNLRGTFQRGQKLYDFAERFCQGLRLRQVDMVQDGIAGSTATLTKMTHKLRLVCKKALKMFKSKTGQRMGGRTEFIVIDESNFRHKRKYGQGRAGQTWKRKKWVFGMLAIKGQRRRPILRLVERRSRNHLVPIIRRHVRQGSTILSDEWFVDPNHGGHTQNIERAWLTYKSQIWRLRGNRTEKLLKEHLSFIEWTYWLGYEHKDGPLGCLLEDIKRYYRN